MVVWVYRSTALRYLKGVLGAVAGPPDAYGLQHACVVQLLQNQRLVQTHLLLLAENNTAALEITSKIKALNYNS